MPGVDGFSLFTYLGLGGGGGGGDGGGFRVSTGGDKEVRRDEGGGLGRCYWRGGLDLFFAPFGILLGPLFGAVSG